MRHASFEALLEEDPLLRRMFVPWSKGSEDPGARRAMSLLKTYDATNIMRIGTQPVELVVLAFLPAATDPRFVSNCSLHSALMSFFMRGGLAHDRDPTG